MPKITLGNIKVEMTVEEFIEFISKTEPTQILPKLQALGKTPEKTETETEQPTPPE